MLISVVVPVYNAAAVIERCVNSILAQDFDSYEIVLVNDGSKDNSLEICKKFVSDRIKIVDQTNSGASSARNSGILAASGDYVCFIDSDDYVSPNFLSDFFVSQNSDYVFVIQDIYRDRGTSIEVNARYRNEVVDIDDVDKLIIDYHLLRFGFPFAKLYNRRILIDNSILFDSEIHFSEDLLFMLDYLRHCKRIHFLSNANYYYVTSEGGLSTRYNSFESEYKCFIQYVNLSQSIFDLSKAQLPAKRFILGGAGHFLTRSIESMYRPSTFKPRKERIRQLNDLFTKSNYLYYRYWNRTILKFPARIFFLLSFTCLFDTYYSLLFTARYRADYLWVRYIKKLIRF